MDIQMPVMDGLDATRAILRIAPDTCVLGQTAHAMPEERDACLDAGMAATITKPIDHEVMVSTILLHMRARSSQTLMNEEAKRANNGARPDGLIDWVRLEHRYQRHRHFVPRLLRIAVTSLEPVPTALRAAAAERNLPELARIAHTVRGTCGELFAEHVLEVAGAFEQAARGFSQDAVAQTERLAGLVHAVLGEARAGLLTRTESSAGSPLSP